MRLDLKDAFIKTFEDMEWSGIFWAEFRLPRQSGATTSLVRAAYQLKTNGEKVLVAFSSLKFANHSLKDAPYSEKPIKPTAVSALYDALYSDKAYLGDDTIYVLIDNLQFAPIKDQDLEKLKSLVKFSAGKIRVLVVDTGIK